MEHIICIENRSPDVIARLVDVWESSVRETHLFLTEDDIGAIKPEVPTGLSAIEHLYCYQDEQGVLLGFIGVAERKIEMLFVDAAARGKGIGRQLIDFAIINLHAIFVDVNEQNTQGVGFYQHLGFSIVGRDEQDEQGRPFPILHMRKWNPSHDD